MWEIASSGRQHSIERRTPVSSEYIIVSVHTVSVDVCWLSVFTDVVVVSCSGSVRLSLTSRRLLLMSGS